MAHAYLDLAHLLKVNDQNLADFEVDEVFQEAPVAARLFAQESSNGEYHKWTAYDTPPTVGFRSVNAGLENTKSDDTIVSTTLKLLDGSFLVDSAVADAYTKGGRDAYIRKEAKRHLGAALFALEGQFLYGTGELSAGFGGIAEQLADLGTRCLSAGGSTANEQTSVYFVNTGEDRISALYKSDQIQIGESVTQMVKDADGKNYTGLWTPMQGWYGLQIGSLECIARLANIHPTDNSGANALNDDMIFDALSVFRGKYRPDFMVMSRAALNMLRKSRTATNGSGSPAPVPTEVDGVPIVVSEKVSNTEAVVTDPA